MDLSEIIMRAVYLGVLFVVISMLFTSFTPLRGNPLIATSFFGAALVFYVSFSRVYQYLSNNELVLNLKKSGEGDSSSGSNNGGDSDDESTAKNKTTSVYNETNISNKKNETNDTNINHTHSYLENVSSE